MKLKKYPINKKYTNGQEKKESMCVGLRQAQLLPAFFKKKIEATHHMLRVCPISWHVTKKIKGGIFWTENSIIKSLSHKNLSKSYTNHLITLKHSRHT